MTPNQQERLQTKIKRIKAALAADKRQWGGFYHDGGGLHGGFMTVASSTEKSALSYGTFYPFALAVIIKSTSIVGASFIK